MSELLAPKEVTSTEIVGRFVTTSESLPPVIFSASLGWLILSQHDTLQRYTEIITKSCGKNLHKSGDTVFHKLRSVVKVKMLMCPKQYFEWHAK
jgi:hypothetical protein